MKCEKCNVEIAEGKGYYFTLKGAICTRCYDNPRYELEIRNIAPQSYNNSWPCPNLSINTPLPPFAWNEPSRYRCNTIYSKATPSSQLFTH